ISTLIAPLNGFVIAWLVLSWPELTPRHVCRCFASHPAECGRTNWWLPDLCVCSPRCIVARDAVPDADRVDGLGD
ncbi:MAG TPA: hypothetical protein VGF38_03990, partial [Ktedonobacterales bacterium]